MFYKESVYSICRFLCTVVFYRILLVFSSFFLWPILYFLLRLQNHISGTMASVLASSGENHGFEPRSGQAKDYKIDIFANLFVIKIFLYYGHCIFFSVFKTT
jgi:hypothetical protein